MNQKPVACRFCRTDLRLKYGPKAPRCNVFAKLENKDLLKLHQNKDAKYVVIADYMIDSGKPLQNKASIPSKFFLAVGHKQREVSKRCFTLTNANGIIWATIIQE